MTTTPTTTPTATVRDAIPKRFRRHYHDDDIVGFRGEWRFLSNFHRSPILTRVGGWPTAEHLYQASKSVNPDDWTLVRHCRTAGEAKRHGRLLLPRPDWEDVKLGVMLHVSRLKYGQNGHLATGLVSTGDAEIVEFNNWGDTFWGVCEGEGENHLGRILMKVRGEIRAKVKGPFPFDWYCPGFGVRELVTTDTHTNRKE